MRIRVPSDWWRRGFFDPSFYTPADLSHTAAAGREVRCVLKRLGLRRGSAVLDLCCGPGRHSLVLAAKGFRVTGLDYSRAYIAQARAGARKAGLDCRFVRGDMRRLPFRAEFDAVINLFTSFGYFDRWSDNAAVLKGVARALKPGGLFLLELMHGKWLRSRFTPKSWCLQDRGFHLLEERELVRGGRRILNRWIRIAPNGRVREKTFSLWLLDRAALSGLMRRADLRPLGFWGGLDGTPLSDAANRLVALARR